MDEIDKYFTRLEPLVRKPVFTGTSARCRIVPSTSQPKRPIKLTGDVKETLEEDIECMREMMKKNMMVNNVVTDASDGAIDDVHVRYNLKKSHSSRKLPIYESKQQILEALEKNSALVITGNTGCGKTTQVSLFYLETSVRRSKLKLLSPLNGIDLGTANDHRRCIFKEEALQHCRNTTTSNCRSEHSRTRM